MSFFCLWFCSVVLSVAVTCLVHTCCMFSLLLHPNQQSCMFPVQQKRKLTHRRELEHRWSFFFGSFVAHFFSQEHQNLQICLLLSLFVYQTSAAPLPPPPPLPVAPAQPSQSSAYTTAQREPQPAPSSWTSLTSGKGSLVPPPPGLDRP